MDSPGNANEGTIVRPGDIADIGYMRLLAAKPSFASRLFVSELAGQK
jgi:hypothetical protein